MPMKLGKTLAVAALSVGLSMGVACGASAAGNSGVQQGAAGLTGSSSVQEQMNKEEKTMDTLEIIKARKSTRSFENRQVERDKLLQIAQAGLEAPCGLAKPVYATIVTDREKIDQIDQATKKAMAGIPAFAGAVNNSDFSPTHHAPAVILVSTDTVANARDKSNNDLDAGAAGENMCLAATALGLGSCFVTSPTLGFTVPGVKEAVGIPENQTVNALILVGYTDNLARTTAHPNENNVRFAE